MTHDTRTLALAEWSVSTLDTVHHMDALALCNALPSGSVDMILADLPYGTTQAAFDVLIPFGPMWAAFERVIKPAGPIVLTASQPFTSMLVMSNLRTFRYEWIWRKSQGSNFLDANKKPFKAHESILIFADVPPAYYPQMRTGKPYRSFTSSKTTIYGAFKAVQTVSDGDRYPLSVLSFDVEDRGYHPTQKPVDLFRYLIRTYTQRGDLVLDPTCGSGTTALAAREEGRHFICGDSSAEYVAIARKRLAMPYTLPLVFSEETA